MDNDLYNILSNLGQNAQVPVAGSAFAQALDAAAQREAMMQMKHREEHLAQLDDLANQGMFEQYLTQGTAFKPRELGTGAVRDRKTLQDGMPPPTGKSEIKNDPVPGSARMQVTMGDVALSPSASFRGLPRVGGEGTPLNGGEASVGAQSDPEQVGTIAQGRGVNRTPPQIQRPNNGYQPRRTAEGRKEAASFREKVFSERENTARTGLGKGEQAREAELRAATQLTLQQMRDAAALLRVRAKPSGKDEVFKWMKEQQDNAQKAEDGLRRQLGDLALGGFQTQPIFGAVQQQLDDAKRQREDWDRQLAQVGSQRGAPPPPGGGSSSQTRTAPDGSKWRKVQGGWEQM